MARILFVVLFNLVIIEMTFPQIIFQNCEKESYWLYSLPCNTDDYILVFEDNFVGDTLNLSNWIPQTGVSRDEYFTLSKQWYSPNNVEVSNGTLKLIAKEEQSTHTISIPDPPYEQEVTFDYSSAEIVSKHEFLFGKYEIRCRMPNGKGFWPAFWMYGGQRYNELDYFDNLEGTDRYELGIYYDFDGNNEPYECRWESENNPDLSQWHTYTFIYDYDKITWQIDYQTFYTFYHFYTNPDEIPIDCTDNPAIGTYLQQKSYPVEYMSLIATLAIRSGDSAPDNNTPFPSSLEIDYIKYFKRKDCCNDLLISSTSQFINEDPAVLNFICGDDIVFDGDITIQDGQNAKIVAANSITLEPEMHIESGSVFSASINSSLCSLKSSKSISTESSTINNEELYDKDISYINEIEEMEIEFYPNPTQNFLNIKIPNTRNLKENKVCIINIQGQKLLEKVISGYHMTLDLSGYTKGIYILRIIDENMGTVNSKKFSVE